MKRLSNRKVTFLAGTLEHGGAERQLFYMLQALCREGAAPRLISLDRGGFWEDRIQGLGVPIEHAGDSPSRLARLFSVLKKLRKDRPEIVQSQHFFANAYAALGARFARAAGIGAMRNDGVSEARGSGPLGGWMNLRLPAVLAANSHAAIQYASSKGIPESRLYFLPNVVDTERFKPAASASSGPAVLLAAGRLVKQKRFDRFLAILARLRSEHGLDARGLIVGPGCKDEDLGPELTSQARALRLHPDLVEFRGGVSDMRPVYHEAAACVLTSDFEGTPNVVLEAMASGLPVVASRVGGVPGIIRHGETGQLLEPQNVEGFAAALAGLLRSADRGAEMGRRARAWIEERASLHRLPALLEDLHQRARPEPRPAAAPVAEAASV